MCVFLFIPTPPSGDCSAFRSHIRWSVRSDVEPHVSRPSTLMRTDNYDRTTGLLLVSLSSLFPVILSEICFPSSVPSSRYRQHADSTRRSIVGPHSPARSCGCGFGSRSRACLVHNNIRLVTIRTRTTRRGLRFSHSVFESINFRNRSTTFIAYFSTTKIHKHRSIPLVLENLGCFLPGR